MAKVFLDTNTFIDAIHRHPEKVIIDQLEHHISFISPLSVHIYCYLFKIKMPSQILVQQLEKFSISDLSPTILLNATQGPTEDLEDNIQLHCASDAECDIFLTNDKNLLNLGFFGKTKITANLT